ncbi:hypothetical protein BVX95_00785 [archaeon D22]|nr:hypothetical protein BVX95_00785 [archaeon D22]
MGANAIITFKVMPESPDVDFDAIVEKAKEILTAEGAKGDVASEIVPLAFGLKEIKILGMFEMKDDSFDPIADKLAEIEGVNTAEIFKMDLAMG